MIVDAAKQDLIDAQLNMVEKSSKQLSKIVDGLSFLPKSVGQLESVLNCKLDKLSREDRKPGFDEFGSFFHHTVNFSFNGNKLEQTYLVLIKNNYFKLDGKCRVIKTAVNDFTIEFASLSFALNMYQYILTLSEKTLMKSCLCHIASPLIEEL